MKVKKINEFVFRSREWLYIGIVILALLGCYKVIAKESFFPPDLLPHPHLPYPNNDPNPVPASK